MLAAAAAAQAAGADIFVSIGGGSAINLTKMIQVALAKNATEVAQLDALHLRLGADGQTVSPAIRPSDLQQITVPTTLFAAEFTHTASTVDELGKKKDLNVAQELCPMAVILDPAISLHTPE